MQANMGRQVDGSWSSVSVMSDMALRKLAIFAWHKWACSAAYIRALFNVLDEESLEALWKQHSGHADWVSIPQAIVMGEEIEQAYHASKTVLLCPCDHAYPPLLKELCSPPILGVKGDYRILTRAQMAVVGSRQTIEVSRQLTPTIADALMMQGYIVTSGGAIGIDALAHRQAMVRDQPTVVVSALGTEQIYPKENADIFEYAKHCGAIVSQFPNGGLHHKPNFPLRNDVIAGLSMGVILVQCPSKSGALYTLNAARRLHRPVFVAAMPGFEPRTEGGLEYVKSGRAQLLSSCLDLKIADEGRGEPKQRTLGFDILQNSSKTPQVLHAEQPLSVTQMAILKALSHAPATQEILRQTLQFPEDFDEALLELELEGQIRSVAGLIQSCI